MLGRKVEKPPAERSVCRSLKNNRDDAHVGRNFFDLHCHARWQLFRVNDDIPAKVRAADVERRGKAVSPADIDLLAILPVAFDSWNCENKAWPDGLKLNTVDEVLATPAEMIANPQVVFTIGRNVEAEVAVRSALVIVGCNRAAGSIVEVHDRVDR